MSTTRITGTGSALPDKVLTNAELSKIVETSDEWITTRTGIKERRVASETMATSDLSIAAARKALAAAELAPEKLDSSPLARLIIFSLPLPAWSRKPWGPRMPLLSMCLPPVQVLYTPWQWETALSRPGPTITP
jgi:hypothetical protein